MNSSKRICLLPRLAGVGGMVSFQARLAGGLQKRGYEVCFDLKDLPYSSILVIGGTRDLAGLWRARRQGIPIIQRLNGMNWIHRRRPTGLRHYLRAEYGNWVLSTIRGRLASMIVYQSRFSKAWWERVYGPSLVPNCVIYNGVDLQVFNPVGPGSRPQDPCRLLLVEGSLGGGYELGLETAVQLAARLKAGSGREVELVVAGSVTKELSEAWNRRAPVPVHFLGKVSPDRIPEIDRSAHLLYSADLQAACPNSVVEALACGLPVLAFDTGALSEMVADQAGQVVPYGGDAWKLEPPDIPGLAMAALEILDGQETFRAAARRRAETQFGLDPMVESYLRALQG